jgi:hypothetical protein
MSGVQHPSMLSVTKEVAVNAWIHAQNWAWLILMMVPWLLLAAAVGYAAVLVTLRDLHRNVPSGRP